MTIEEKIKALLWERHVILKDSVVKEIIATVRDHQPAKEWVDPGEGTPYLFNEDEEPVSKEEAISVIQQIRKDLENEI